jgi:hypothetical protein
MMAELLSRGAIPTEKGLINYSVFNKVLKETMKGEGELKAIDKIIQGNLLDYFLTSK